MIIDTNKMSPEEIQYFMNVAEGYARMRERNDRASFIKKKLNGKNVSVLDHLIRSGESIALLFANNSNYNQILYEDGEGTFYVIRTNKTTNKDYVVRTHLNYKNDTVKISVASDDTITDLKNIKDIFGEDPIHNNIKWKLIRSDNFSITYKVSWEDLNTAFDMMADDDMYLDDLWHEVTKSPLCL